MSSRASTRQTVAGARGGRGPRWPVELVTIHLGHSTTTWSPGCWPGKRASEPPRAAPAGLETVAAERWLDRLGCSTAAASSPSLAQEGDSDRLVAASLRRPARAARWSEHRLRRRLLPRRAAGRGLRVFGLERSAAGLAAAPPGRGRGAVRHPVGPARSGPTASWVSVSRSPSTSPRSPPGGWSSWSPRRRRGRFSPPPRRARAGWACQRAAA